MGEEVHSVVIFDLHQHIYNLLEKYVHNKKGRSSSEEQQEITVLLQQSFSLLLLYPPDITEHIIFETIMNLWAEESVDKFFFN